MKRPENISLRRKLATRSKSIVEHKYCYHHEYDKYVVVDASYAFNKCMHQKYYNNLCVTAAKIKLLNNDASKDDVVDALKYVMFNMEKSVYYPTVHIVEAEGIVDKIWNENPDNVERIIHGDDVPAVICQACLYHG